MKEIFEKTCRCLGKNPADFNAEVHFINAEEIRKANLKWRGVDKATDVLSFPLIDWRKIAPEGGIARLHTPHNYLRDVYKLDINPVTDKIELGDIVICRECAGEYSDKFLYLHGLLHLFGFTHDTDEDEEAMNAVVKEVLDIE